MKHETTIRVSDYYGHPELYPFMPRDFFATLESAFIAGLEYALVDADELDTMMSNYKHATL